MIDPSPRPSATHGIVVRTMRRGQTITLDTPQGVVEIRLTQVRRSDATVAVRAPKSIRIGRGEDTALSPVAAPQAQPGPPAAGEPGLAMREASVLDHEFGDYQPLDDDADRLQAEIAATEEAERRRLRREAAEKITIIARLRAATRSVRQVREHMGKGATVDATA